MKHWGKPMAKERRVHLISLGCAKNLVDSENMLGILKERGFAPVPDLGEAEIAIINTCGFIQPSVEEALDTILEVAAEKRKGRLKKLFVAGCLVQRYGYKLKRELPEVDGWIGTGEIPLIGRVLDQEGCGEKGLLIGRPEYLADHKTPRLRTTPFYTAYLKIAEGCSHGCTYCTIPKLRGPFRSRSLDSLVLEAEGLAQAGVKEINLIAQDTTMYGQDLRPKVTLPSVEPIGHIVEETPRRFHLGGHLCKHPLKPLMFDDRPAERVALLGIGDRLFQSTPGDPHGLGRYLQAALFKKPFRLLEPAPLRADPVLQRHPCL